LLDGGASKGWRSEPGCEDEEGGGGCQEMLVEIAIARETWLCVE